MTRNRIDWPWWIPAAALTAAIVFCLAVWVGLFNLAGIGARFAEAKDMEGRWGREMVFDTAQPLTTGRSVSVKRD